MRRTRFRLVTHVVIAIGLVGCRAAQPRPAHTRAPDAASGHETRSARVYFGVIDPVSRDPNGDAFAGYYVPREQRFHSDSIMVSPEMKPPFPLPPYVAAIPGHRALAGVTPAGAPAEVVVDRLVPPEGDLYEGTLSAHVIGTQVYPVLFWTPGVDLTVLHHTAVTLDSASYSTLRAAAESLFTAALHDGDPDVMPGVRMVLGDARVEHVEGMDSLVVVGYRPVLHADSAGVADSLASIFMVYSPIRRRVVFGRFGHPEWSAQAMHIAAINPLVYFRLGRDPRTYFFGWYSGPWEDNGYGVAELATGRILLRT